MQTVVGHWYYKVVRHARISHLRSIWILDLKRDFLEGKNKEREKVVNDIHISPIPSIPVPFPSRTSTNPSSKQHNFGMAYM